MGYLTWVQLSYPIVQTHNVIYTIHTRQNNKKLQVYHSLNDIIFAMIHTSCFFIELDEAEIKWYSRNNQSVKSITSQSFFLKFT
jgi:hypothetical protein